MPLNLDLSAVDAKIARARVHLDPLERELTAVLDERKPYTLRGHVDPQTGWCSVFLVAPDKVAEHGLGVIVGDIIHNLRCALDYIVTALVEASGASLVRRHQFAIYDDAVAYKKDVGDERSARSSGMLQGVKYGLSEIWGLQPFNTKTDPIDEPLFLINRFSNTDKHRMIVEYLTTLSNVSVEMRGHGVIVEDIPVPLAIDWEPNREYEIARVRFAAPYPPDIHVESTAPVSVFFAAPAFGKNTFNDAMPAEMLKPLCDYVAEVVDSFKAL